MGDSDIRNKKNKVKNSLVLIFGPNRFSIVEKLDFNNSKFFTFIDLERLFKFLNVVIHQLKIDIILFSSGSIVCHSDCHNKRRQPPRNLTPLPGVAAIEPCRRWQEPDTVRRNIRGTGNVAARPTGNTTKRSIAGRCRNRD